MVGSDENFAGVIRPTTTQGGGLRARGGKSGSAMGQNRRVLSDINKNIIGAPTADPYAASKTAASSRDKHVIPSKNPTVAVHRPVTRTFAAQLASKRPQPLPAEKRPRLQAVHDEFGSKDCSVVDAEAIIEEIDEMDVEVEMEDISNEPLLDIDSADKENPLAVVEYVDDIYAHYRKEEMSCCASPRYMSQQYDITGKMRGILIDWLIEVHYKFELLEETLYLTVNLIDRFLERQTVARKKLQLVGITAMLLACKYEEVSVPVVEDFIVISDRAYTRTEVLDMEKIMVNALQFNLSVPTPYVFIKRFLKATQSHKELELLAFYLIELCLVEYEMLRFPPSLLAAAAVFTAQCTLCRSRQRTTVCEMHSRYSEHRLSECSKMMVRIHEKAGTEKLVAVFKKYGMSRYGYVARTQPACFMLESNFWV